LYDAIAQPFSNHVLRPWCELPRFSRRLASKPCLYLVIT